MSLGSNCMALLVQGEWISDEEIAQERSMLEAALLVVDSGVDQGLRRRAEENLVYRALLRQQAQASGIRVSAQEVQAELRFRRRAPGSTVCGAGEQQAIEQDLIVQRYTAQITRAAAKPSRRELEAAYHAHHMSFQLPERIHVRHIVKNIEGCWTEEKAMTHMQAAEAELRSLRRFEKVADRYSDCRGNGGDLGWIARGEMVEEFEAEVFGLNVGQITGIFRTPFGFHIATLVRRSPAHIQSFQEVRGALEEALLQEKKQALLLEHLKASAANAEIRAVAPFDNPE